jgi:hypothetical protein
LVLHDHRTGGPRSSGSLTDMIRSIGSRLVSPGRWLAAMHDHQARKLPIFCISAYGWRPAVVASTTAGSTSSFPCFFLLPIICASWLRPLCLNSQLMWLYLSL